MWVALFITLREGIEAALIVGIVAGFLRQSGYSHLMPKVWLGVILAALLKFRRSSRNSWSAYWAWWPWAC